MRRTRSRQLRIVVLWTVFMFVVAAALAAQALVSLNGAEQACFMNYPSTPCPTGDDPAVIRLTMAFIAVPLGWLIGLVVIGFGWWVARRQASER
jgi:hypothetical protein